MSIDLDAARAARREARGEAPTVIFGGETFTLPVEMPFQITEQLARLNGSSNGSSTSEAVLAVVRLLLGEQYDTFMGHAPSMDDLTELASGAMKEYGLGPGESRASRRSSGTTSRRSKRTSKPTTG